MSQGWGVPPQGPGQGYAPTQQQPQQSWGYGPQAPQPLVPYEQNGHWSCHFCGHFGEPNRKREISEKGIIIAVVLGILCFPLALIPLLTMKDEKLSCARCGALFSRDH